MKKNSLMNLHRCLRLAAVLNSTAETLTIVKVALSRNLGRNLYRW